jgi:ParB family chromosome partitioning protein
MVLNIDPLGLIEEALGERKEGVQMLGVGEIKPNPVQPRQTFDDEALAELANSIRQHGVLQPLVVQPAADGAGFVLLCGERRWRASQLAGLREVPVVVHAPVDEATARMLSLVENLQREDLNDIERAEAIVALKQQLEVSWQDLAKRLGMSERRVMQLAALVRLGEPIQAMIGEGRLTARHGQVLGKLRDRDTQVERAEQAAAAQWTADQLMREIAPDLQRERQARLAKAQKTLAEREKMIDTDPRKDPEGAARRMRSPGADAMLTIAVYFSQEAKTMKWEKVPKKDRKRMRTVLERVLAEASRALEEL